MRTELELKLETDLICLECGSEPTRVNRDHLRETKYCSPKCLSRNSAPEEMHEFFHVWESIPFYMQDDFINDQVEAYSSVGGKSLSFWVGIRNHFNYSKRGLSAKQKACVGKSFVDKYGYDWADLTQTKSPHTHRHSDA
jgi:hypothetical protein